MYTNDEAYVNGRLRQTLVRYRGEPVICTGAVTDEVVLRSREAKVRRELPTDGFVGTVHP